MKSATLDLTPALSAAAAAMWEYVRLPEQPTNLADAPDDDKMLVETFVEVCLAAAAPVIVQQVFNALGVKGDALPVQRPGSN